MAEVIIGVDPHRLSATIEVVGTHEAVLGSGRFATDKAGLRGDAHVCEDVAGSCLGGRGCQRRWAGAGATPARVG